MMQLRVGFEMVYQCVQPTPMMLMLSIHPSRVADLVRPDLLVTDPAVPVTSYLDLFGNRCSRLVAPQGRLVLSSNAVVNDSGLPDSVAPGAVQSAVEDLPASTLIYLLGSRFCETELLSNIAWQRFASVPAGWARVQAICDFVHQHIEFGYPHARSTRTAMEAYTEGRGVCRDYAHLMCSLARASNIPARYTSVYGAEVDPPDFHAVAQVWLDGGWHLVDATGMGTPARLAVIASGRDAVDVAFMENVSGAQPINQVIQVSDCD